MCVVSSSVLRVAVRGTCGERVLPVPRLHQSVHLPAALSPPGLPVREQLFVHSTGPLHLSVLQARGPHRLQIASLWMWLVEPFLPVVGSKKSKTMAPLELKFVLSIECNCFVCYLHAGVVCLGGMLYSSCVSSCGRSCRALSGMEMCNPDDCAEGCGCPDGSYYDDVRQRCVQLWVVTLLIHHPDCGHPFPVKQNHTCKYAGKKMVQTQGTIVSWWSHFSLFSALHFFSFSDFTRAASHSQSSLKKLHCGQFWPSAKAAAWYLADICQGTDTWLSPAWERNQSLVWHHTDCWSPELSVPAHFPKSPASETSKCELFSILEC